MTIMQLKSYFDGRSKTRGWTNQEMAEFYRVSDILSRSGLLIAVDQGLTDEGDPWLVFFREETGDVIAHFARVNSQFVAVSSLDNRLYRGDDVRRVVQQMLDSHPMFLPRDHKSGRLLLHPSAALTAFVAAAFILSIDGIKAKTLSEILVEVSNSNLVQESQTEDSLRNEIARLELSRVAAMDLTPLNYNAAVYGMVVIARQFLPEEEIHKTSDSELSVKAPLDEFYGELNASTSESIAGLGLEVRERSASESHRENALELKEDLNETEILEAAPDETVNEASDKKFVSASVTEAINEIFKTSNVDFIEIQTSAGDKNVFSYTVDLSDLAQEVISQNFDQTGRDESYFLVSDQLGKAEDEKDLKLDPNAIANSVFEKLQAVVSEELAEINALKDGELFFVGFDDGVTDNSALLKNFYFDDKLEEAVEMLSSVSTQIESLPEVASEFVGKSTVYPPQPTFKPELPIIGHDIQKVGQKYAPMTNAIDVVFYRGGDFTVTNYELGKDLLWLLLPPEDLSSLNSYIRNGTDLVMNFGELGALTFPGVFSDVSSMDTLLL